MTFQELAANVVSFASIGVVALTAGIFPASAKVEGDVIVLGSVVSFTGKYSTSGTHTKNGYDLAVKRINEAGGVKVGGKSYKFRIKYYDDKSKSADAAKLAERLIRQDGINRHSPDDIQLRGNCTGVPPPRELYPLCSHPMA